MYIGELGLIKSREVRHHLRLMRDPFAGFHILRVGCQYARPSCCRKRHSKRTLPTFDSTSNPSNLAMEIPRSHLRPAPRFAARVARSASVSTDLS